MRRGRVPDLLLTALLDGPAHGYELMDRLEQSSGGSWRPSPGSVYPLLQVFEDNGLVKSHEEQGRRVFALTDYGSEQAAERRTDAAAADFPWDAHHNELRAEVEQLRAAARQINTAATPDQQDQAAEIVRRARQALYRLLAE